MLTEENNKKIFSKQYHLWNEFINQITYENRFFPQHEIINRLKNIAEIMTIVEHKDTVLYRARIYNGNTDFIEEFYDSFNQPAKEVTEEENLESYLRKKLSEIDKTKKEILKYAKNLAFGVMKKATASFLNMLIALIMVGRIHIKLNTFI